MRLEIFLKISMIISLLTACGSLPLPKKPKIEMGVIDASDSANVTVITNKLNTAAITDKSQLAYRAVVKSLRSSKYKRVPISAYDKAIAIPNRSWEALENYRNELEDYARNRCNF